MKYIFNFTLLISLLISTLSARDIGMVIDKDTILTEDLVIKDGEICTIKPGVTIKFAGYYSIKVSGLILIEGSAAKPILITALDRARGETDWAGWKGFDIRGENADAVIRNCRIEGAYRNVIYGTRPVIDSSQFVGNHEAIRCVAKAAPHIKNSTFNRNRYGIYVDHAMPLLLDNLITDNKIGIYTQMNASMIAGRNVIEHNDIDIKSSESFGKSRDATEIKKVWDIMRQLY